MDIICFAVARNLREVDILVEKIRALDGVMMTETFPVLKEG